jgi:hypothetical protein
MKKDWLLLILVVHILSYSFLRFGSKYAELAYDIATGFECFMFSIYLLANNKNSYFAWSIVFFEAVCAISNCFKLNYAYTADGQINYIYIGVWMTLIFLCFTAYILDNKWKFFK